MFGAVLLRFSESWLFTTWLCSHIMSFNPQHNLMNKDDYCSHFIDEKKNPGIFIIETNNIKQKQGQR